MEQCKWVLNKCLNPNKIIIVLSIPLTVALMLYVFIGGHKDSAFAIVSYVVSAYSLVIVGIQTVKISIHIKHSVHDLIQSSHHLKRYVSDVSFRSKLNLYPSLLINVCYAMMNLGFGISYHSFWFGTLAAYYCFLAVMRFLLLRHVNKNDLILEIKQYRFCGLMILLTNIAFLGVVILVVSDNKGFRYSGMLIYVMAMYAFYSITRAIINVMKYRKQVSPVIRASKAINLIVAFVSMFSLETAMLSQFDTSDDLFTRQLMIGLTGAAVCIIVFGIAVYMMIKANRELKDITSRA